MRRKMCAHCGTVFDLKRKPSGEIGRIESCRWVRWDPQPRSLYQRARWWIAALLYDAASWFSR